MIAAGLLAGVVASSCEYSDADVFNDRASELVCDIYDKCDEDITVAFDLGRGSLDMGCYGQVRDNFDVCDSNCGFNPGKARRCIRRLERMADDCEVLSLGPCRRVYDDCDGSVGGDGTCELWNCSVGSGAGGPAGGLMALGLLVLGMSGRRRRFVG